jgi:hypothetical protein
LEVLKTTTTTNINIYHPNMACVHDISTKTDLTVHLLPTRATSNPNYNHRTTRKAIKETIRKGGEKLAADWAKPMRAIKL